MQACATIDRRAASGRDSREALLFPVKGLAQIAVCAAHTLKADSL